MGNAGYSKTLQMLVWKDWLVDAIIKLGSGYSTHLSYQYSEIEPEVLADVHNSTLGSGVLGDVIYQGKDSACPLALAEIFKVNDFNDSIRFDFRLLSVNPYLRNRTVRRNPNYACYYKPEE